MGTVCCKQPIESFIHLNHLDKKNNQKQTNPVIANFRIEKKKTKIPMKRTKVRKIF
jgi:hypothetical protein